MKKYLQIMAVILSVALFPVVSANAKDKVRIGGDVVVEEGTEVKDAVAVGGSVTVNGTVRDSAVAVGGSVGSGVAEAFRPGDMRGTYQRLPSRQ